MHCRRLLHRSVLTALSEAGWAAQVPQTCRTLLTVPLLAAASSVYPHLARLLNTQSRLKPRALSQSRARRHPSPNRASTIEPRGQITPTYTAYDPSIHTASTHPPLRVLYGSFHPTSTFAILYKPPNLSVSSLPPNDSVERRLREGWAGVAGRRRVWFPHRLDKHTEGVMVVVFDGLLNARMGREIAGKRWVKRYRLVGELPHSVPASRVAADKDGVEEEEAVESRFGEEKGNAKAEAHERRLSKMRCTHLNGSLLNSHGLLQSGLLSSHLARRPPPPPAATIDYDAEEQRWAIDLSPSTNATTRYTSPSTSTHSRTRRIHPFVPETMLYYSVPADRVAAREAVTRYRLLDVDGGWRQAMWEAELVTGRSHQLRVHWSDAGCPVVNDPYYNHRYVWQQVQQEKTRRARLAAGDNKQKPLEERGEEEQLEDKLDRPVILVRKVEEERQQSVVHDEREEEEEQQEQAGRDQEMHASESNQSAASRTPIPSSITHRPPPSRLTPLGPSYRILPPALTRVFSTQSWQSVLDRYGVKSTVVADGGRRQHARGERGVVDDVESMAELREAEEEESIEQLIRAKRERKQQRKNRQQVEELDMDDLQAMEQDEVELYPITTTDNDNRPARDTSEATTRPQKPPACSAPSSTTAPVDNPLASAGWLAMLSPSVRSPFATTSHGMRLQSYYLSMPHPTRAGYELTVVAPLPRQWTSEQRWPTAEAEWNKWQFREQKQNSLGRFRWLGREKERKARSERKATEVHSPGTNR